jgi:hypothetical protein
MTSVPENPMGRLVEGHITSLTPDANELVDRIIFVGESGETREPKVITVQAYNEHRTERSVASKLKEKATEKVPLSQV